MIGVMTKGHMDLGHTALPRAGAVADDVYSLDPWGRQAVAPGGVIGIK
jgi:hypothetical protein